MPRITLELVERSNQSVNPAGLRQLTLRGNHIEVLENLGITRDHYECLDFSDNNILRITQFPVLSRLKSLVLANNHIQRIAADAFDNLPSLQSVVLTKNKLKQLADIAPLAVCKKLERLTVRENDICNHEHYRSYVIYVLRETQLKVLDFQKVSQKDREAAINLFEKLNPTLLEEIAPARQSKEEHREKLRAALTAEQKLQYQQLIAAAQSQEEVDKLSAMFAAGEAPPAAGGAAGDQEAAGEEDVEMRED